MRSGMAVTVGGQSVEKSERSSRRGLGALALVAVLCLSVLSGAGGMVGAASATNHTTIDNCGVVLDSDDTYTIGSDLAAGNSPCIEITSSQVTLDGDGHTISGSGDAHAIYVHGGDDFLINQVEVENLAVEGVMTGVNAENVGSLEIRDVSVSDVYQGFSLSNVPGGEGPARIEDSTVSDASSYGIEIDDSEVYVSGTTVSGSGDDGIAVLQATATLQENVVEANQGDGILLEAAPDTSLIDNTVDGNQGAGVRVQDSDDVTLRGNDVLANNRGSDGGAAGIRVTNSADVTVADQLVRNNDGVGLSLRNADGVAVRNSRITQTRGESYGVRLEGTSDAWFVGSDVSDNRMIGMLADGSSPNLTVRDTTFNDNGYYGIGGVENAVLSNVTANGNGNDGIQAATGTTMRDVTARDNDGTGLMADGTASVDGGTFAGNGNVQVYATDELTASDVTVSGTHLDGFTASQVALNGTAAEPTLPADRSVLGRNVTVVGHADAAYFALDVRYTEAESSGLDEATLSLWRHADGWSELGGTVDAGANAFSANVTEFGRLTLLAEAASPSNGGGGGNGGSVGGGNAGTPDIALNDTDVSTETVEPGDTVRVEVTLENSGDGDGTETVDLTVDGERVASQKVLVRAGTTSTLDFQHTLSAAGEYEFVTENESIGTVTAAIQETATPDDGAGTDETPAPTDAPTSTPTPTDTPTATSTGTTDDAGGAAPGPDDGGDGGLGPLVIVALLAIVVALVGAGYLATRSE